MSRSGPHQIPLERYIAHFLKDVPFPSPQRPRILIQLSTTAITLSQPDESPLPKSGASFIEFLKNLGPTNCITILLFTLMEQKLLIHSLRPAVLTSVAEAVINIIFPFHWQCPYIPLCPLALSYVLNSPTPFIVGIDSRYFDLYDPPSDVTCIDLDTNTLTISEDRKGQTLKMMPKKAVKVLKATLEKLYEHLCQNPAYSGASNQEWLETEDGQSETDFSGWKKEMLMETSIQEAFLRFMAVILKGYNNFLLPIIEAPTIVTTDVSSLFDIQGFLKSRDRAYHKFYTAVMKTQAFSRFIEERSFVSDKDTCLAFFDECVEKVDDNKDDVKLFDSEDSLQSERTVFVMPPEPIALPEGVEYNYNGFPLLDVSLFPIVTPIPPQPVSTLKSSAESNLSSFLCSPMTRRTKHELKSAQKIAMKHSNIPRMWANCLVWHCYSLWFIHLPAYMKIVHSKTKALRVAYNVLSKAQSQSGRLQPPDEVCYRVMMQLCGLYHQPVMAVKVLFEMRRNGVQPNAVTYGFYNKAVLESKWPTSETRGYQLWTRLRHVVMAVAQFKQSWQARRQSVYSNSESDLDGQSLDSFLDSEHVSTSIIKDLKAKGLGKRSRTESETGQNHTLTAASEERISSGGLSDRGYGSATFEDGKRISLVLGSQNSLDLTLNRLPTSGGGTVLVASDPTSASSSNGSRKGQDAADGGPVVQSVNTTKDDSGTSDHTVGTVTTPSSCGTVASSPLSYTSPAAAANEQNSVEEAATPDDLIVVDDSSASLPILAEDCVADVTMVPCGNGVTESEKEYVMNVIDKLTLGGRRASDSVDLSSPETNTDVEATESRGSSLTSPVHGLLVPVTENDPLGVFNHTLENLRATEDEGGPRPDDGQIVSRLLSSDVRLFGRAEDSVAVEPMNNGIAAEMGRRASLDKEEEFKTPKDVTEKPTLSSHRSKSSGRSEVFGNVMRSAATRLLSKYNDIKKSIATTPGSKADSGSINSINSLGVEPAPTMTSCVVDSSSANGDRVSTDDSEISVPVVSSDVAELTPPKGRLRVPILYNPLASVWGGLKTFDTKEAFHGIASSLEHISASVLRGSFMENWNTAAGEAKNGCSMDYERRGGMVENGEGEDGVKDLGHDELDDGTGLQELNFLSDVKGGIGCDLDHVVPVEENSDRGSLTGDQSSFRFSTGSMLSLPQSSAPVEVEMSTLSKCQSCGNLLYDEEIMAGWTSDDSNLNTSCQFCGQGVVPFIHIYIRDYRQSLRSTMSNLSQSVESMLSVQSAPVAANRRTVAGDTQVDGASTATAAAGVISNLRPVPSGDGSNQSARSRPAQALETMPEMSAENDEQAESLNGICVPTGAGTSSVASIKIVDGVKVSDCNDEEVREQEHEEAGGELNDETNHYGDVECNDAVDDNDVRAMNDLEAVESKENEFHGRTPAAVGGFSQSVTRECKETVTDNGGEKDEDKVTGSRFCADRSSAPAGNTDKNWRLNDLDLSSSCHTKVKKRTESGRLESRRCTSECSLDRLPAESEVGMKCSHSRRMKDADKLLGGCDGASIRSNGSDDKNSPRRFVELDPITVPYLSPLVLRKELENVLDQDGDLCLNRPEFVDQHPILYWNLVWYFKRLDVPSHMPGFILTARSLNKNTTVPSSSSCQWSPSDSRNVAIFCMWDNVRLHQDHGPPMYILWNQVQNPQQSNPSISCYSAETSDMFSRSVMITILNHIKNNDVTSPLRLILKERSKRRKQTSKTRFHSIYRDLLFLSFAALGRENIDHESFDREFKSMFAELPAHDSARLRNADRTPNSTAIWCRKMFHELHLGSF